MRDDKIPRDAKRFPKQKNAPPKPRFAAASTGRFAQSGIGADSVGAYVPLFLKNFGGFFKAVRGKAPALRYIGSRGASMRSRPQPRQAQRVGSSASVVISSVPSAAIAQLFTRGRRADAIHSGRSAAAAASQR